MAWKIGICEACSYSAPDHSGGTHYSVFKVRQHYFSLLRLKRLRRWAWICDECQSQTAQQRKRNSPNPKEATA
jgi:hypothetical protein